MIKIQFQNLYSLRLKKNIFENVINVFSILSILIIFIYIATKGDLNNLFASVPLSTIFDSLAEHLKKGSGNVDIEALSFEAFYTKDGYTTYFGAFPALLRIFLSNFADPCLMLGKWATISILLASFFIILGNYFIAKYISNAHFLNSNFKIFIKFFLLVLLCFGVPIIWLLKNIKVYHEPIIWGYAFSLWGIYFIIRIINCPNFKFNYFLSLSFFAGISLISRTTFALPLITALISLIGFKALPILINKNISYKKIIVKFILILSPLIGFGIFQMWFNYIRFDNPLKLIDFKQFALYPSFRGVLDNLGAFHFLRIPESLKFYFGIDLEWRYPYFFAHIPSQNLVHNGLIQFLHVDLVSCSIVSLSLWLIILGVTSPILIFKKINFLEIILLCCFFLQINLIITFFFICFRYVYDFIPFLLFSTFLLLKYLPLNHRRKLIYLLPLFIYSIINNIWYS